jgi:peptidoglycan/LPS O-acetylase OafA/YrhL
MITPNAQGSAGNTVGAYMKNLWIIFLAMAFGVLSATVLLFTLSDGASPDTQEIYVYIGFGFAMTAGLGGLFVFRQLLVRAQEQPSLSSKLDAYLKAYLVILATFEGAALLNMVLYFINGDSGNFFVGLAMTVVMLTRYPSKVQIGSALQLSDREQSQLMKDDVVL